MDPSSAGPFGAEAPRQDSAPSNAGPVGTRGGTQGAGAGAPASSLGATSASAASQSYSTGTGVYAYLATGQKLEVNTLVEVDFKGQGRWFPGRISKVRGDGLFDIVYDDGDKEKGVPDDRINFIAQPEPGPPPEEEKKGQKKKLQGNSWTPEEDEAVKRLVEASGPKDWNRLASQFAGEGLSVEFRSGKQIRDRWYNVLDPTIVSTAWTEEEQIVLRKAHDELGNRWSDICRRLPGRSENQVKSMIRAAQLQYQQQQAEALAAAKLEKKAKATAAVAFANAAAVNAVSVYANAEPEMQKN